MFFLADFLKGGKTTGRQLTHTRKRTTIETVTQQQALKPSTVRKKAKLTKEVGTIE